MTDIPFDLRVWDSDECAEYLHQSRDKFMRDTRYGVDFPKQLEYSKAGQPRWSAKAVVDWALK